MPDFHGVAGLDRDGITGKDFRLDLDVGGVADFEDGSAGSDNHFALLHDLEHTPGDGAFHFHQVPTGNRVGPFQCGAGLGEFVVDDLQGKLRGTDFGGFHRGIAFHPVAVGGGDAALAGDGAHAVAVGIGHFQGGALCFERFGCLLAGRLAHRDNGFRLGAGAGIQQRRGGRLDAGQEGFPGNDVVAGLERDTEHFSGHGCSDDVAVPDTGLAFLGNADGQRAADDHAGFDDHGLGPQPPGKKGDQEQHAKPGQGAADEVFSIRAELGFPWWGGGGVSR